MDLQDSVAVGASVLVSLGGSGAIVVGLSSWLGKVWAARILEDDRAKYSTELTAMKSDFEQTNRRLQAQLDRSSVVHKLHFETEFGSLKSIWAQIMRVRACMEIVRLPETDQNDERAYADIQHKLKGLTEAYDGLTTLIRESSPFYAEEIYKSLELVLFYAHREQLSVKQATAESLKQSNWRQQGLTHLQLFNQQAEIVSTLIRTRLTRLTIVDRT